MFDTHCHLNLGRLYDNQSKVIDSAKKAGVEYILVPGTDLETSKKALETSKKNNNIFAAVGLHPTVELNSKDLILIEGLTKSSNRVVAVGEIGLDYYHLNNAKEKQILFFEKQLKLALKYKKPVIIHNRFSEKDLLNVLISLGPGKFTSRTVFHCCEPSKRLLEFAKKHKYFIGVDGDLTYDQKKEEFIKKVPLDMLLLETDSPYLKPLPVRKNKDDDTNEPKNLIWIAKKVAEIKEKPLNEIIDKTTGNAKKLFGV